MLDLQPGPLAYTFLLSWFLRNLSKDCNMSGTVKRLSLVTTQIGFRPDLTKVVDWALNYVTTYLPGVGVGL